MRTWRCFAQRRTGVDKWSISVRLGDLWSEHQKNMSFPSQSGSILQKYSGRSVTFCRILLLGLGAVLDRLYPHFRRISNPFCKFLSNPLFWMVQSSFCHRVDLRLVGQTTFRISQLDTIMDTISTAIEKWRTHGTMGSGQRNWAYSMPQMSRSRCDLPCWWLVRGGC